MATGMSWQHYYSSAGASVGTAKFGSANCSAMPHHPGANLEYTQDLHLKMSKKIAQLTKVIYALNTKNDEHEVAMQALKEAHEEEIEQIFADTREKILQCKNKVGDVLDLRKRIQYLEESLEQHEKIKQQALLEFESYKQRVEDMQLCKEAQHTQHIVTMCSEVEEVRRNYENMLQNITKLQLQFEKDKHTALEEMRAIHRLEVEELLKKQQKQSFSLTVEQEKLEELHRIETEELNNRIEGLKIERKNLIDDYEAKLSKAQAFYEHELEALKRSQQFTADSLLTWKQREAELQKEFQMHEAASQMMLSKLKADLHVVQEEATELKDKCQKLQAALTTAENSSQLLLVELEDARLEAVSSLRKQKELESELAAAKEHLQQQNTDLLLKSSHIGMLQATEMTHEAKIRDLEAEKSKMKEKIMHLEEETKLLQNKNQTLDEQKQEQLQKLQTALDEAKQNDRDAFEKEIMILRRKYEEEGNCLKEIHTKTLTELCQKHQAALETVKSTANREKQELQMEMEQQFEKDRLKLEEQKNQLRQQLENLREELTAKLKTANEEVYRLQDLVKRSEQGLGSAEEHISSLKNAQERLQQELDSTRARLRETSDMLSSVQGEMEQQRLQHETLLATVKQEERFKLEKLTSSLELKWTENLRVECSKVREELMQQHEEDKKSAMTQLLLLKDKEINAVRDGWQKKVDDLLDQRHSLGEALHKSISNISLLKQNLEMQLSHSQNALQQLQAQYNQEHQRMSEELNELEAQHQHRQKSCEEAHLIALKNIEDAKDLELKELEECLKKKHTSELESLKEAHQISMDALRQEMEQELQTLRFELEDEGKAMLASLRSELNHQHAAMIDQLRQGFQQELEAGRMELEGTLEHSKKQEKELQHRISDLQDELGKRENHINELEKKLLSLQDGNNTLAKELEFKGKEILKVRSETNQHIRLHEQEVSKKHEKELNELTAAHIRETQSMLVDFNKAQELLKDKISALQILLEEMEEKYQNRESRPEDLQLIVGLKDMVTERDQLIKKLIEDKKFYQLELVNRETNFNKVFNASPTVGIINPLTKVFLCVISSASGITYTLAEQRFTSEIHFGVAINTTGFIRWIYFMGQFSSWLEYNTDLWHLYIWSIVAL
ncbi:protein FAM184A [Protopterus annectens]|uniref:protein FAM184A n=1 Tax=Protopterus annectens TaxID=7888 RepID=UPI001CF9D4A3|nr:protein FAM184A [Protopterus annectens]